MYGLSHKRNSLPQIFKFACVQSIWRPFQILSSEIIIHNNYDNYSILTCMRNKLYSSNPKAQSGVMGDMNGGELTENQII